MTNPERILHFTVHLNLMVPELFNIAKKLTFEINLSAKNPQIVDKWIQETVNNINSILESISSNGTIHYEDNLDIPENLNSKFQMVQGSYIGNYGDPVLFFNGLDDMIGLPDLRITAGIRNEHLFANDSRDEFKTYNYGGTVTTPALEYEFIADPNPQVTYPGTDDSDVPRFIRDISLYTSHEFAIKAGLSTAEILALRLYTGPMYMKYNAVLRGFPPALFESLKGNKYTTTIHSIVSGIIKLSRITPLPFNHKVYRGLGGMLLPEKFWKVDEWGCKGGVEYGFMSTTTNKDIALLYAGKSNQMNTVFEIDVGQIDRGASISWLSQYPGEAEVLMPPLCNLEVVGTPSIEKISNVSILILQLRLNVNLKSRTLDEIMSTRKRLHLATMRNLIDESRRMVADKNITMEFVWLHEEQSKRSMEWFNNDENYRTCLVEMINMQTGILKKDSLLKYARWCLTGARCTDAEDGQDAADSRDRESLMASYSSSTVPPPSSSDFQLFSNVLRLFRPLALVYYDLKRTCTPASFQHESLRVQYSVLLAMTSLLTGDITSTDPIDWRLLLETETIKTALEKIVSEASSRLQIFKAALIADLKIERMNKLIAVGRAIAEREEKAKESFVQKMDCQINCINESLEVDKKLFVNEDSRIIKILPPVEFKHHKCPWLFPSVTLTPLPLPISIPMNTATATSESWQLLTDEFELFDKLVAETLPYHQAEAELRKRREIGWAQNQLNAIISDPNGWADSNVDEISHINSFLANYSNKDTLIQKKMTLCTQNDANRRELLSPAECVCNALQLQHSALLASLDGCIRDALMMIHNTFQIDSSRLYMEIKYFLMHIISIAANSSSDEEDSSDFDLDDMSTDSSVEGGTSLPNRQEATTVKPAAATTTTTTDFDINKVIGLMRTRCEIYVADPLTAMECYPSLPSPNIDYFEVPPMSVEEMRSVLRPLEGVLGDVVSSWRLQYPEFDRLLSSLRLFEDSDCRSLTEKIRVYRRMVTYCSQSHLAGGSGVGSGGGGVRTLREEVGSIVSDLRARLDVSLSMSHVVDMLSMLDLFDAYNSTEDDDVAVRATLMLRIQVRWHRTVFKYLRVDDDFWCIRTLEHRIRHYSSVFPCIHNSIDMISAFGAPLFAKPEFEKRLRGAIDQLCAVAFDEDVLWYNAFDERFAMISPYKLLQGDFTDHRQALENLEALYGLQRPEYSSFRSPKLRRTIAEKCAWQRNLPLADQYRYEKELFWLCGVTKGKEALDPELALHYSRHSVGRMLELAQTCLSSEAVGSEVELTSELFGMGGYSLSDAMNLLTKVSKPDKWLDVGAQMRWLGALSVPYSRIGIFITKDLVGNDASVVSFTSLTKDQIRFLIGFIYFSRTDVKFKLGDKDQQPFSFTSLWPLRGSTVWEFVRDVSSEQLDISLELVFAGELSGLPDQYTAPLDVCLGKKSIYTMRKKEICDIKLFSLVGEMFCSRGAAGMSIVCSLVSMLEGLQVLNVHLAKLADSLLLELLPGIRSLVKLESLSITFSGITDLGAGELAKILPNLRAIHTIDLSGNAIGDVGVCSLCDVFCVLPYLRRVVLSRNRISEIGAEGLTRYISSGGSSGLETIDISEQTAVDEPPFDREALKQIWITSGKDGQHIAV